MVAGERGEARKILGELGALAGKRYVSPYDVATVYAGFGERAESMRWLRKARAEHASFAIHAGCNPTLASLRADAEFERLLGGCRGERGEAAGGVACGGESSVATGRRGVGPSLARPRLGRGTRRRSPQG